MKKTSINNTISQHDFARIWNTLLSKVRAMVRTVKCLPVTVLSLDQSCDDIQKWLFVADRLNSDKEFCDEMKNRIGAIVELKAEYWSSVEIKVVLKNINSNIPEQPKGSMMHSRPP